MYEARLRALEGRCFYLLKGTATKTKVAGRNERVFCSPISNNNIMVGIKVEPNYFVGPEDPYSWPRNHM